MPKSYDLDYDDSLSYQASEVTNKWYGNKQNVRISECCPKKCVYNGYSCNNYNNYNNNGLLIPYKEADRRFDVQERRKFCTCKKSCEKKKNSCNPCAKKC